MCQVTVTSDAGEIVEAIRAIELTYHQESSKQAANLKVCTAPPNDTAVTVDPGTIQEFEATAANHQIQD